MSSLRHYFFNVKMPYAECEGLYLGHTRHVVMTAETGERVQVPAVNIKPFIEVRGFVGRFKLTVDQSNKIVELVRVNQ